MPPMQHPVLVEEINDPAAGSAINAWWESRGPCWGVPRRVVEERRGVLVVGHLAGNASVRFWWDVQRGEAGSTQRPLLGEVVYIQRRLFSRSGEVAWSTGAPRVLDRARSSCYAASLSASTGVFEIV